MLLVAILALIVGSTPALAQGSDIEVTGGGWGHGIGMSQYGALGQAEAGATGEEIVTYYYDGTEVRALTDTLDPDSFVVADATPLWVGLMQDTTTVTFQAETPGTEIRLCNGPGTSECPRYTAVPGEVWTFATVGDGTGECQFFRDGEPQGDPGTCNGSLKWSGQPEARIRILDLPSSKQVLAHGTVRLRRPADAPGFHVILELPLEEYLYGLAEVPHSWPGEALRAQALAGRTYAVYEMLTYGDQSSFSDTRKADCWCHLYATPRSQNYAGWSNEDSPEDAAWKAAVDSTAGMVITHPTAAYTRSSVISAFYFSSSGGATENNTDIWPGGAQREYLVSRPDPWSATEANPFASWTYRYSEADLLAAFAADELDGIRVVERFESGTPAVVEVTVRRDGDQVFTEVWSGPDLYYGLGLRSPHIDGIDFGAIDLVAGDFAPGRGVAAFVDANAAWWVGGGAEFATESWANWNTNTGWEERVVGDFDGDGRDDVAGYRPSSGNWWVAVSDGTEFDATNWGGFDDEAPGFSAMRVGDFDGDGRDDIAAYAGSQGTWWVLRSTGTAFAPAEAWLTFVTMRDNWGDQLVGDFDGDGRDDIGSYNPGSGRITMSLSTGTSFGKKIWTQYGKKTGWGTMAVGDYDGDGRDDWAAYNPNSGKWWISRSLGDRFASPEAWGRFYGKKKGWGPQLVGDFDGDGRADIANHNPTTGKWWVMRSTGAGFAKSNWGSIGPGPLLDAVATDLDGDGTTDLAAIDANRRWGLAYGDGGSFRIAHSTAFPGTA